MNSAINPLTAILGVPNGELLNVPHVVKLLKTLTEESVNVALRSGVVFPPAYGNTEQAIHNAAYEHVKDVVINTAKNRFQWILYKL